MHVFRWVFHSTSSAISKCIIIHFEHTHLLESNDDKTFKVYNLQLCAACFFPLSHSSFCMKWSIIKWLCNSTCLTWIFEATSSNVNASFVWSFSVALLRHKNTSKKSTHSSDVWFNTKLTLCTDSKLYKLKFAFQHPVEIGVSCKVTIRISFRFCCQAKVVLSCIHLRYFSPTRLFSIGSYAIVAIASI